MINHYISFFDSGNEERQEELIRCLEINTDNKHIDKIYILLEDPNYCIPQFNNKKIELVKYGKRPTYKSVFAFINSLNLKNTIHIVSNTDIYYDDTIELLKSVDFENKLIALTRYETKDNKIVIHHNDRGSQDSWIFYENVQFDKADIDFYFGIFGCDNRLVYEMRRQGYKIINPCIQIKSYHLHNVVVPSKNPIPMGGNYGFVPKTLI